MDFFVKKVTLYYFTNGLMKAQFWYVKRLYLMEKQWCILKNQSTFNKWKLPDENTMVTKLKIG